MDYKLKARKMLNIISKCLKEYDINLLSKKVMFIIEGNNKMLSLVEVYFPKSSFYHLIYTVLPVSASFFTTCR